MSDRVYSDSFAAGRREVVAQWNSDRKQLIARLDAECAALAECKKERDGLEVRNIALKVLADTWAEHAALAVDMARANLAALVKARAQVAQMRAALEFYANEQHWRDHDTVDIGVGNQVIPETCTVHREGGPARARAALSATASHFGEGSNESI